MLNKIQPSITFARRTRAAFLSLAIAAVSLASCKDDKDNVKPDDGNPPAEDKAFLPEKDQIYTYRILDSDGEKSSSTLQVVNTKDSSGIAVYDIENVIQEGRVFVTTRSRAFSKGGLTTNEMLHEDAVHALYDIVNEFAEIEDVTMSGFPQKQVLENKGTVGSNVTFGKDPLKVDMALLIPIDEQNKIEADWETTLTYLDGKATKQEEITTPAGTFKCTKWEYKYEMHIKLSSLFIPVEETEDVCTVELWTAPGVGIVKSIETVGEDSSTTELQKITKK
ncbi:TapB family protein [Dyadobacter psychrophilus]|uniref:DUF3108 domain-containing protein n=1 Tax=Dyadobacter psychrophilus TaxID=651661 RepID=A0A1T5CN84_9BACT|nr:hypothetical protein [Dyadobacter psychrophilus]SKB60968.1 hypothetical protein SAMN05660293_01403 [Dyadobacter psychrophilus]